MRSIYINLDSRPDRRAQAEAEFARVGITVERFGAIPSDNHPLSFNKSVYGCMKESEGDDLLLFEDDVCFDTDKVSFPIPPYGFMSLHLGTNLIGMSTTVWKMPTKYNSRLAILHNAWQSHATLYSSECVKYILDNFRFVTDEYLKEGLMIFDEWFRLNVLPMGKSYVLNPMIAFQRESYSDIWNCPANYKGAHIQGNDWMRKNL